MSRNDGCDASATVTVAGDPEPVDDIGRDVFVTTDGRMVFMEDAVVEILKLAPVD